jgi:hypothetical protein
VAVLLVAFVTTFDYTDHTGLEPGPTTDAALEAACDVVRDYVSQQLDLVEDDVITIHGTGTRALLLPELPVNAVTTVTVNGAALTDWTVDSDGLLWRNSPGWWERGFQYVVTYDHGYETVPAILKRVACQLAAAAVRPAGVKAESAGPFSVTYDEGDGLALLSVLNRRIVKRIPVP